MKRTENAVIDTAEIETADGVFVARFSANGLAQLDFPRSRAAKKRLSPNARRPAPKLREWIALTRRALNRALAGKAPATLPPLDWNGGTDFQRAVWHTLSRIPCGEVITYSQLAAKAGRPKAVRAAGAACGANPIPVLVPCHRVLAAKGRLGGFSGGLDWKRQLLEREGA